MKLVSSLVSGTGLAVIVSMMTLGACGGDKSAVTATGGVSATGGAGTTGGDNTAGGSTSDSTGGSTTAGGTSAASTCPPVFVPDNPLMTNFTEQTVGTTLASSMSWGDGSATLTGGTFTYQQDTADAPTATVTADSAGNNGLTITASVAAEHYSGIGFYFGPNCGSDACAYSGIAFDISGTSTAGDLDIQVQMTPDYPLNDNSKGTCDYAAADAGKWVYCTNPHVLLSTVLTGGVSALTATPQTVKVPWDKLVGGNPVGPIDCHQLLGIQFQVTCGTTACTLNVTLDNLTFYI
jgi:hypothetical protein